MQMKDGHAQDHCRRQQAHVHLGELEEGVKVDVAIKHIHGGSRWRNPEVSKSLVSHVFTTGISTC